MRRGGGREWPAKDLWANHCFMKSMEKSWKRKLRNFRHNCLDLCMK
jgi:hypothetical protein